MMDDKVLRNFSLSGISTESAILRNFYKIGTSDISKIHEDSEKLSLATKQLSQEVDDFQQKIADVSLLSVVVLWAKSALGGVCGENNVKTMLELIDKGIFKVYDSGSLISLKDYPNHQMIIEALRRQTDRSFDAIEELVLFYLNFGIWLSKLTFQYISVPEDRDRQITARRKIPFEKYLQLASIVKLRERTLLKLFYFGKNPTREEIFALTLDSVNFGDRCISFSDRKVHYPQHVFEDLKSIVGNRKTGFVFSSKTGERLSFSVPYRKFKRALSKLRMEPSLTFNDLSIDS